LESVAQVVVASPQIPGFFLWLQRGQGNPAAASVENADLLLWERAVEGREIFAHLGLQHVDELICILGETVLISDVDGNQFSITYPSSNRHS
jgi:hypothetical protein